MSATVRASETRFFIPPESEDGRSRSTSRPRFTNPSTSPTRAEICSSDQCVCSRSAKAMFSKTVIESNSAPPWKSMPTFLRTETSSSSGSREISTPSTQTSPESGCSRPFMCRSETDFPVPEPPRITRTSPRWTVRSTSSRTRRELYFLRTRLNSMMGPPDGPVGLHEPHDRRLADRHWNPRCRTMKSFVRKKSDMSTAIEATTTAIVVARPTPSAPPEAFRPL